MVQAYVMANIEAGNEGAVLAALRTIDGIKKASLTYGVYDMCIDVELETIEELDTFVFNILRKIPGIQGTVTLITSKTISP
jgi:DNA-binding Lrp family transcriptional regulator